MENTTTNRQLLNRLQALCEGTPYELRIRERENSIGLSFYTRADAPEYTPYMSFRFSGWVFRIMM